MEWEIDDQALVTQAAPAVEQGSFDQPGALVMEQGLPEMGWNDLDQ
jgi:hypothetical protein